MKTNSSIPEAFLLVIQVELENHPEGISEYNLLTNLKSQGYFDSLSQFALPHELFQAHFFLFHALYLLSNNFSEKKHLLDIHTLKIQLLPYQEGKNNLQVDDKLKKYYLNFNNLENTKEEDVYDMLASFWNKYNKLDTREEALSELGLKDPVDDDGDIKNEYRRLAMQHHPDRGGDKEKLQKINSALALLL